MSGKLETIWLKREHSEPMKLITRGVLDSGKGLQGDINYDSPRAVTIIERSRWDRVEQELGARVDPASRRANLLISGLDLKNSKGKHLQIGSVVLEIRGETRPCQLMDTMHPGLRDALDADWGGGAYARVLSSGPIQTGDSVAWVDQEAAQD